MDPGRNGGTGRVLVPGESAFKKALAGALFFRSVPQSTKFGLVEDEPAGT